MAKVLSSASIQEGAVVEASHVSQSIKAFTGTEDYDIKISGSLTITGSTNILGTASANYFVGNGSQLTSIDTGSWNGIFSGSAQITGSLNLPNTPITASAVSTSATIFSGADLTATRRLNSPIIRNGGNTIGVDGGLNSTGSIIGNADLTIATVTASSHISSSGGNLIGNKLQADDYFQGPELTERINLSVSGRGDYIAGGQTIVRMETNKITINKSASFVESITASADITASGTSTLFIPTIKSVDTIDRGAPASTLKMTGSVELTGSFSLTGSHHQSFTTLDVTATPASTTSLPAGGGIFIIRQQRTSALSINQYDLDLTQAINSSPGTIYDLYIAKYTGTTPLVLGIAPPGGSANFYVNGVSVGSSPNDICTVISSSSPGKGCHIRIIPLGDKSCSLAATYGVTGI